MKRKFLLKTVSDPKCGEFHLLPTLTFSWVTKDQKRELAFIGSGYCIAVEFGIWAVYLGIIYVKS